MIYLIAFISLWVQVQGLYGSSGIFPIADYLQRIQERFGNIYFQLPSVFWFSASNAALHMVCGAGVFFSLLIIIGVVPSLALLGAWFLYLSFLMVGGPFLSFQWDILLLETGFLAIFLAPLQMKPNFRRETPPSVIAVFLVHFLLFKLMLSSGLVKLASHDPNWRALTALNFHYETQPLPTGTSYALHQLPTWFQKISAFLMFVIELGFPFLIFSPRRLRYAAFFGLTSLQAVIALTGNYTFFNYLAILLCLMLLDDTFWPERLQKWVAGKRALSPEFPSPNWPKVVMTPVLVLILFLNAIFWPLRFGGEAFIPSALVTLATNLNRFQFVNNYGLFAVMTTNRAEIIVEGSNDGKTWLPYEFKYKPGELSRRPVFVAPHQPRLDWQMWFAALGTARDNPWFVNFCARLLEGSQPVLRLLGKNPFPNAPPRYVRAVMCDYHFTTWREKKESGRWWKKSNEKIYLAPVSLRGSVGEQS